MGSPPTLAHHELAAEALELDPDDWHHGHVTAHLAAEQAFDRLNPGFEATVRGGDVLQQAQVQLLEDLRTRGGRVRLAEALENDPPTDDDRELVVGRRVELARQRAAEWAFDRLNPEFGVPADSLTRYGQQAVRDREAALSLGTRVAVASSRENDRDPVVWLAGQDYRAADAIQAARTQPIRMRQPAERAGAER